MVSPGDLPENTFQSIIHSGHSAGAAKILAARSRSPRKYVLRNARGPMPFSVSSTFGQLAALIDSIAIAEAH